jgi:hypothetical protein
MRRRPLFALLLLASVVILAALSVLLLNNTGPGHVFVYSPQIYFESHPKNNNNDKPQQRILCWITSYERGIQVGLLYTF